MGQNKRVTEQEMLYNGLKKTIHYYFEMYDKTKNGESFIKQEYYRSLHIEFGRTKKYYELRMSNISHVLQEHYNVEHLKGLKPLFGVGKNVQNNIIDIIDKNKYLFENSIINKKNKKLKKLPNQEAGDDDITIKRLIRQKIRKGQQKFRNNLLVNYSKKCCISNCNVIDVLEASHIYKFSLSGINHSSNGLLLRRDIHKLFDNGLIKINPNSKKIEVNKTLIGTEYYKFNNSKISKDIYGKFPKKDFLIKKYNEY